MLLYIIPQSIAGAFVFLLFRYFKDGVRRVRGVGSLDRLLVSDPAAVSVWEGLQGLTCSFLAGVHLEGELVFSTVFSSAHPVWQQGITCHLYVSPSHGVSVHLVDI